MKRIGFALVLLLILACNLPAPTLLSTPLSRSPTPIPPPLPTFAAESPTSIPPALTFTPTIPPATPTWTETPTITPTFTPSVPMVTPKDQPVNCRYGPGAVWLAVSALKLGASAEIVGRDDANAWWYIKDPLHPGAFCWVSMAVTNASGKLEGLPIIPPPEAQVIDASVSVNVAPGGVCPGPISLAFSGSITTNGPATVTYRWEIRGDTTLTSSSESHVFAKADTWTFSSDHLHLSCGSFRVILHILTPNDFRAEKRFRLP